MSYTIFPTLPREVAVLTPAEFGCNLEWDNAPSLDNVCRRFGDDTNRALVWFIRFRALKAWCGRVESAHWMKAEQRLHICELAARFELNDQWEFDARDFDRAVDANCSKSSSRERR